VAKPEIFRVRVESASIFGIEAVKSAPSKTRKNTSSKSNPYLVHDSRIPEVLRHEKGVVVGRKYPTCTLVVKGLKGPNEPPRIVGVSWGLRQNLSRREGHSLVGELAFRYLLVSLENRLFTLSAHGE